MYNNVLTIIEKNDKIIYIFNHIICRKVCEI